MIATSENLDQGLAARLRIPVLLVLAGFLAVQGLIANGLLAMNTLWGPQGRQVLVSLSIDLFIVVAIWGLSRLAPSRFKTMALAMLLAFAALLGCSGTVVLGKALLYNNLSGIWYWKTMVLMAGNLLAACGAIWGFLRLKPWAALKTSGEPVSPTTRKTNKLLGLAILVGMLGMLALVLGTGSKDNPFGLFSNSTIAPGIAIFAISCWLLSMVINKWYWYFSADEHERKSDDVGNLAGWALFITVTPAWWVASRAGLLPQPDAMVLWVVGVGVSAIGYFWRRNA
jgi:hypothetical protein